MMHTCFCDVLFADILVTIVYVMTELEGMRTEPTDTTCLPCEDLANLGEIVSWTETGRGWSIHYNLPIFLSQD